MVNTFLNDNCYHLVKNLNTKKIRFIFAFVKLFAYILSAAILFFSFKPAVEMVIAQSNEVHSCCSMEVLTSDSSSDDCEDYSCNPFIFCCVNGFIHNTPILLQFEDFEIFNRLNPVEILAMYTEYNPEFWQPPKIV